MAKPAAVWGIDIGQSGLKALRCLQGEGGTVIADAFDFVEYGKILSQPDVTNASDLVRDALAQFLSRNKVRGDKIVISVPGQSGLARFIKLPPVEASKIPDIVRYEAKQQIPFPLEEVVWDYQQISGGSAEEFALETEVGLFAMKRDQVYKALEPFNNAEVEVDVIQLTPLALYNFILFDQMHDIPPEDQFDPDNPPESTVVMSMGTDSTDLVVTNGYRVWQRSIPVGGNHFTKALVKDLKLNFAMAEHMKRNSAAAEDPKALFQAMRPVFGDLLTEVQRSLGYFKNNVDRAATIGKVVVLGNVMKLPGLQKYLAQNLGYEVTKIERFRGLTGGGVVDTTAFRDNILAYGVCYGLALQGLKLGRIHTNLLPREIMQDRMIRAKKPWAAAAAALVMSGCALSYFAWFTARESVALDSGATVKWTGEMSSASSLVTDQNGKRRDFDEEKAKFLKTDEVGRSLLQNVATRDQWMELLQTVNMCLPVESKLKDRDPKNIDQRMEVKIDSITCRWSENLGDWQQRTDANYRKKKDESKGSNQGNNSGEPMLGEQPPPDGNAPADGNAPPSGPRPLKLRGPGWVVLIRGHHYHNNPTELPSNRGIEFLKATFFANLSQEQVVIPQEKRVAGGPAFIDLKKDVGIVLPVISESPLVDLNFMRPGGPGEGDEKLPGDQRRVKQPRQEFAIQFAWVPGGVSDKQEPTAEEAPPQPQ